MNLSLVDRAAQTGMAPSGFHRALSIHARADSGDHAPEAPACHPPPGSSLMPQGVSAGLWATFLLLCIAGEWNVHRWTLQLMTRLNDTAPAKGFVGPTQRRFPTDARSFLLESPFPTTHSGSIHQK